VQAHAEFGEVEQLQVLHVYLADSALSTPPPPLHAEVVHSVATPVCDVISKSTPNERCLTPHLFDSRTLRLATGKPHGQATIGGLSGKPRIALALEPASLCHC